MNVHTFRLHCVFSKLNDRYHKRHCEKPDIFWRHLAVKYGTFGIFDQKELATLAEDLTYAAGG